MRGDLFQQPSSHKLDTWKEIASFFGRDERTVKRWEKERGLPVHRVPGGRRGTVYAFPEELTAWLRCSQQTEVAKGQGTSEAESVAPIGPRPVSPLATHAWRTAVVALALTLIILLGFVRFFKLHSVQGHLLPSISTRTNSAAHKQAEDLYLQGRYHWNKRTPADLTLALDMFTKAAQLDPNFALAYAGKADSYNLLREYTSMPASQAFPLAIAGAKKAIALDDSLAEGHRALAFALFYWEWDISGAEREFKRAIELNPKDVEAHHWYATALMSLSRYPEAIAEIERARHLDPLSSSIAADRAEILYMSGRRDEGIALLEELKAADPGFYSPPSYLSGIYFEQRDYKKYFAEAETAAKLARDDHALTALPASRKQFETGGERALLQSVLEDRLQALQQGRGDALSVASSYAVLGRNQEAMEYLAKAYERHDYMLISINGWPVFQNLRSDPEYQNLLKRIYTREDSAT
jgi:tetratricopeptide (TPR) repeat protein